MSLASGIVMAIIVFTSIAIGIYLGAFLQKIDLRGKSIDKDSIVACFRDVDWSIITFSCGNIKMSTPDGVEHFYKFASIKEAVDKLNKLLKPRNNSSIADDTKGV